MEPLWGIPFNLIAPFATIYMYRQGIEDIQIGTILSIAMFVQVFFAFFGGIITDKLGRKKATMMGDICGWSIACLVWAISDNFWLFLIAALFNCFEYVNQTAWFCLLIEDADPKDLVGLYTGAMMAGLLAVFFAPISGFLINTYDVVPVVRVLYVIFAVNMMIKAILTWRFCRETKQGQIRREETKGVPLKTMLGEYKGLLSMITGNKEVIKAIAIYVILHIVNMTNGAFFGLYVTQRLGIAESYLAFFPILNASVMLVFMVFLQHRLDKLKLRVPLRGGFILSAACALLLIMTPMENIFLLVIYIFIGAVAGALVGPRNHALLQLNIDIGERARINSMIVTFTIAFSSPFGFLVGWLSRNDRRLPFALIILLLMAAIVIVGKIREPERVEEK
jgi:MFS family permease